MVANIWVVASLVSDNFGGACTHVPGTVFLPVGLAVFAPILMWVVILNHSNLTAWASGSLLNQNSVTSSQVFSMFMNNSFTMLDVGISMDFNDLMTDWLGVVVGMLIRRSLSLDVDINSVLLRFLGDWHSFFMIGS